MNPDRKTNRTGLVAGILGAVVLLAALAVLLDLGPFAEEELNAAEFLAKGDEICAQAHDEFLDLQGSAPRTAEGAAELTRALIDVSEEETDAISSLDAPASLADPLAAYLADRGRGIEILREGLAAAREEDPAAYEDAQAKLARSQKRRAAAARDLGFSECSKPLAG